MSVFGLHEVEADDHRLRALELRLGDLKREQRLRENLLWRKGAQHLVDEANLHGAGRRTFSNDLALGGEIKRKGGIDAADGVQGQRILRVG